MSLQRETRMLRNIPMFAAVDDARLKLLSFTSERVVYMPGEAFIRQGEPGDSAFFIISGEADVVIDTKDGPLTVGDVGANELVGEIALLRGGRRTATVRARTPVTCLVLSKDVFFQLVREFPDVAIAVMYDLAVRLERRTEQLGALFDTRPDSTRGGARSAA